MNRAMAPKISVVMPCYNAEAFLPLSVGSLLAQTFSNWELVAVDDGSTDGTLAWLQAQGDARIHVVSQPNGGVSAARNLALRLASGELVAFLDADDSWAPDFMARMVAALQPRADAVLAYCGWQNVGLPGGRGLPFVPPDYERADKEETLFAGCRWPIHAALARRQALLEAGGFDTRLTQAEDYALWLRVAGRAPIVRLPEVLACYHFRDVGQATSQRAQGALHLLRAQELYLVERPAFAHRIGRKRRRQIMLDRLLQQGYDCYWRRDLTAARTIFRAVMRSGYGAPRDWVYMLPAWMPAAWHRRLLRLRDARARTPHGQA